MFAEGPKALFPGQGKQIVGPFANEKRERGEKRREGEQEVEKGA